MRKLLISILLASAAASPAFAQDQDNERRTQWGDRQESHPERAQAREERQQAREQARAERAGGGDRTEQPGPQRPQFEPRQQTFDRGPAVDARATAERNDIEQSRAARAQRADGVSRWTRENVQQPGETTRWTREPMQRSGEMSRWTRDRDNRAARTGDLRDSDRPTPNVMRSRSPLVVSTRPREGTQPPLRAESRRRAATHWTGEWRRDNRYDWRGWRDRHRSTFHIGIYYDPLGWNYQPYQVGWRLWPSYYGRRYWIEDPYQYRLPYPPAGTVWVRYWNDALLVDTWTGEVVDAIQNFFW